MSSFTTALSVPICTCISLQPPSTSLFLPLSFSFYASSARLLCSVRCCMCLFVVLFFLTSIFSLILMSRACYDPRNVADVWVEIGKEGDQGIINEWLSTHPRPGNI